MGSLVMKIYLLYLVFSLIYFAKIIYKNYLNRCAFYYGQNRIVSNAIVSCAAIGQFLIPSIEKRLIIFLLLLSLFLLLYTIIGLHNQVNHSGDVLLFFQKEIRREKRRIGIGIGLLTITLLLVYFTD